jgi:type IV pilus biogenesis protein CpaD/CtpE
MDNNTTESTTGTIEETANYLQISFSRAPKKNHDALARLGKQIVQWLNKHGVSSKIYYLNNNNSSSENGSFS